ncbi:MAG: HAD hydrolase-like protein [Acidobacteriota bacterium]|nr:HAD hydrolase-like protein [Acidobacteriota bacterium]
MSEIKNTVSPKIQNQDLKILLWDIDGTLLQSTRSGGFKEYFAQALEKVYGTEGKISEVKAAGITDVQIVYQALKDDNFTIESVVADLPEFMKAMCAEMRKYFDAHEKVYEILPGAKEILRATAENPRFANALLTGNVGCGAELKMKYIGIWDYFVDSPNAYGEISHERRDLAIKAGELFNERYDFQFKPEQFIVIGDTPHDITAARHFGAKVICVATGRGVEREDLISNKPDALIENLGDTAAVLEILEKL